MHLLVVAKDHELAGIFDHVIPASADLVFKRTATDQALDIAYGAPDDAALNGRFGGKDRIKPRLAVRLSCLNVHAAIMDPP